MKHEQKAKVKGNIKKIAAKAIKLDRTCTCHTGHTE